MVRGLFGLLIGIYAGIYIAQNFEVPKVDDPQSLMERIKEYAEKYKKD